MSICEYAMGVLSGTHAASFVLAARDAFLAPFHDLADTSMGAVCKQSSRPMPRISPVGRSPICTSIPYAVLTPFRIICRAILPHDESVP